MNLADKPGAYKDFSGEINWKETVCVVRNADFEILEKDNDRGNEIVFVDAVFVSGEVRWSFVENGLNLGCNFYYCDIEYMINKGGKIFSCDWRDGIFEGGFFTESTWCDGIWIKGVWGEVKNNSHEIVKLPPDQWEENKL